ncbi:O-antigen ligase family protein [Mariniflexile sp.]|uniref:O-antigen ligase family protein n=1 Tax=Mariniflexile sp. TaxID=1979402 RepID=UPI003561D634
MANFYNIYFGISLYYLYCKHHFSKFKWVIVLFVCSHISLLSSAGIVLAIFSFLFIYFMNRIENFSISRKNLFWIGTVFVLCTVLLIISFLNNADYNIGEIDGIIKKITFNEDTTNLTSSGQRLSQWTRAISNFIDHPFFGNGPGYGVHQDSEGYLSVYLTILSDIGIFALFSFVLFQIVLIAKIMRIQEPIRGFLLFSVITSFLHLFIIADFYQAPIWVLFVVIQLIYSEFKLNIK